jgi:hypothetical protein
MRRAAAIQAESDHNLRANRIRRALAGLCGGAGRDERFRAAITFRRSRSDHQGWCRIVSGDRAHASKDVHR